jgi:hypothetical protein
VLDSFFQTSLDDDYGRVTQFCLQLEWQRAPSDQTTLVLHNNATAGVALKSQECDRDAILEINLTGLWVNPLSKGATPMVCKAF